MFSLPFRLRYIVLPLICLSFLAYFAHHALIGERGLLSYKRLQDRHIRLEKQLADARKKREKLEARVTLLRPESLDPDMLDERARTILNLARPNEITILQNSN